MILTAIGIFLIIIGVLVFYVYRNPNIKEIKDGSFDPLGYDRLDVVLAYFLAILLIIVGVKTLLL